MNFLDTMRDILRQEGLAVRAELKRPEIEDNDWAAEIKAVHQAVMPPSPEPAKTIPLVTGTATDAYDSILAVKIGGSVVGDFWVCLSEAQPFYPCDGLPVYRPSEVRALKTRGYGVEELRTLHRIKTTFDGTVQ